MNAKFLEIRLEFEYQRVIDRNQSRACACGSDISFVYKIPRSKVPRLNLSWRFDSKFGSDPLLLLRTMENFSLFESKFGSEKL